MFDPDAVAAIDIHTHAEEPCGTHADDGYAEFQAGMPKYFPPILVRYANWLLRHKVLFGSDWPAITPDRCLSDFETLNIKEEVKPLILKENARKVLGI